MRRLLRYRSYSILPFLLLCLLHACFVYATNPDASRPAETDAPATASQSSQSTLFRQLVSSLQQRFAKNFEEKVVSNGSRDVHSGDHAYAHSSQGNADRRRRLLSHSLKKHAPRNKQARETYLREDKARPEYVDSTTGLHTSLPPFPASFKHHNLCLIRDMFQHGFDSYMYHAFPYGEIKPISCQPHEFDLVKVQALTLIDSLDMLVLMGNYTEFARSLERIRGLGNIFDIDQNVSVFETNIRLLGGLLSAHQLASAYLERQVPMKDVWKKDNKVVRWGSDDRSDRCEHTAEKGLQGGKSAEAEAATAICAASSNDGASFEPTDTLNDENMNQNVNVENKTEAFWKYDGYLLDLARDLGERLLPAFDTATGIPYGTVNLRHGVPPRETPVASLAGAGTLSLEMELFSQLVGDDRFGKSARRGTRAIWLRRSPLNLFGKHINVQSGSWTEVLSGVGSNSDSFIEYLAKHYFLFPDDFDYWFMLVIAYNGIYHDSRDGEWYIDVDMAQGKRGGHRRLVLESLMAFYPGMQVLLGEDVPAALSLDSFFLVREYLGFLPERFDFGAWRVGHGGGVHPLRPELLESAYFLHRTTSRNGSSGWLWAADFALQKLAEVTPTKCGFATVKEVTPETTGHTNSSGNDTRFRDDMPSFFLTETLKYLWLSFDDDNVLHTDPSRSWIFTTEAHPVHYAPTRSSSPDRKKDIRELLINRLRRKDPSYIATVSLDDELWIGDKTNITQYHHHISNACMSVAGVRKNTTADMEPFVDPFKSRNDMFDEVSSASNAAHISAHHLGNGPGVLLDKSCNIRSLSANFWMQALNGGILDYSEVHVSSTVDALSSRGTFFSMLGSLDALALYGSGTHLGVPSSEPSCSLGQPLQTGNSNEAAGTATSDGTEQVDELATKPTDPTQRLQTSFGLFEILLFDTGDGFTIQRLSSEQTSTLVVHEIVDDADQSESERFVLTVSSTTEPLGIDDENETFVDAPEDRAQEFTEEMSGVVLSDYHRNSFSCLVTLYATDDSNAVDDILGIYPCAPSFFGPSSMARLVENNGAAVDAVVSVPADSSELERYGCLDKQSTILTDVAAHVSVVRRGICSFLDKSFNGRERSASGVLVINSSPNELFVMSGSLDEEENVSLNDSDLPLTVLLTGEDGATLLDHLNATSANYNEVRAQISLTRVTIPTKEESSEYYSLSWPRVEADGDTLRVFARDGWGFQAEAERGLATQWKIYLFEHSYK